MDYRYTQILEWISMGLTTKAIGILLVLCAALSYFVYRGAVEKGRLEQTNKVLTEASKRAAERAAKDRKVLVAREVALTARARILSREKQELLQALQRNKTWSDTDVPTEVQKALGGPSSPVPDGLQHSPDCTGAAPCGASVGLP